MDFSAMLNRVIRAARLDVSLYNEVEADTSLNREALTVVIIVTILSAVGGFVGSLLLSFDIIPAILGLAWALVWGVAGYYIWAYLTWFIGTRVFKGTAEPGELLRTLGYAYGPNVLGVLAVIPCVGSLAALIGSIWSLVCGVVAVREALDTTTGNAVITVLIGWAVLFVVSLVVGGIIGIGAVGFGSLTGALQ
jgi:hypothetical protein